MAKSRAVLDAVKVAAANERLSNIQRDEEQKEKSKQKYRRDAKCREAGVGFSI